MSNNLSSRKIKIKASKKDSLNDSTFTELDNNSNSKNNLDYSNLFEIFSESSESSIESSDSIDDSINNFEESTLIQRTQIIYTENEYLDIEEDQIVINSQIRKLERNNISIIYENQTDTANKIIETFLNREVVNIMVIGKTQSGKTGTMLATIKKFMNTKDKSIMIPKDNIFIITGLSSCEWIKQTKERLPESIEKNVFHRGGLLDDFIDKIKNKKNVLIIMDEIQIASKYKQTIYKTFLKGLFLNGNSLYQNDIKILEFTATPDGTLYDLNLWKNGAKKILAQPAEKYTSSFSIYQKGKMKQYKDLVSKDKNYRSYYEELQNDINSFSTPMYHIIRNANGKKQEVMINRFKNYFPENNYDYEFYDGMSKDEGGLVELNDILNKEPTKHTFIFIKEMLRCAKTLSKKYLGILYERYSKSNIDSIIIQGLAGRLTGYDYNGHSICYTDTDTIIRYEKLWNSFFEDKKISWKSSKNPTFNHPDVYDETKVSKILKPDIEFMRVPIIIPLEDDSIIFTTTYEGNSKKSREAKHEFLKNKLEELCNNNLFPNYIKLLNFIKKFNCKQFSKPRSTDSHKKHIIDSINAKNENKPFIIDLDDEDKKNSTWQAFIGSPEQGPSCICIIVWSRNPNIY